MRKVYENSNNCESIVRVKKEYLDIKKNVKSIQKFISSTFNKQRLKFEIIAWINSLYLISTLYEQKTRTEQKKIK